MTKGRANNTERGNEEVNDWCAAYELSRNQLRDLARIHLTIDEPARKMGADEPDWICRLRKICLHVSAIIEWKIGDEGLEHVVATELRAAYKQMEAVWKHVPSHLRLDEMEHFGVADKDRKKLLAMYDHPTPQSLLLSLENSDLLKSNYSSSYGWLAMWLGCLVVGYGFSLVHLACILDVKEEVAARVTEVFGDCVAG